MEWIEWINRDSKVLTSWLTFLDSQREPLLDLLKTGPLELSNDQLARRDAEIRGQLKLLDKLESLATIKEKAKSDKAYYDALMEQ